MVLVEVSEQIEEEEDVALLEIEIEEEVDKMPVHKCPNGKYRIGSGKCIYDSKAKAEKAYRGYLAQKHMNEIANFKLELQLIREKLEKRRKWIQKRK